MLRAEALSLGAIPSTDAELSVSRSDRQRGNKSGEGDNGSNRQGRGEGASVVRRRLPAFPVHGSDGTV